MNPEERVYLKQRYIKNGNVYHQGYYLARELPREILNERFLLIQPLDPNNAPSFNNAVKKQKITISAEKPLTEKTAYGEPSPTVVNNTKGKGKTTATPPTTSNLKVKINTATAEELSNLTYVGTAIATKMLEAREEKPFENLDDLQERVKLSRGSWEEIKDNLLFD